MATPILDAAVCAYLAADTPIRGVANTHARVAAALRAALPWDLPVERLEAMAKAWWEAQCTVDNAWKMLHPSKKEMARDYALAAYRADPIMRELYPEKFR